MEDEEWDEEQWKKSLGAHPRRAHLLALDSCFAYVVGEGRTSQVLTEVRDDVARQRDQSGRAVERKIAQQQKRKEIRGQLL